MGGSGKAAKKTNEQKAMERRQRMALDEETAASERRLKSVAQKKLGKQSLLADPVEAPETPEGPTMTEGYVKTKSGRLVKESKLRRGGMFSKFLGAAFGQAATGRGAVKNSLLGKSGDKAAKSAISAVTR
jgi:hypothetical protein